MSTLDQVVTITEARRHLGAVLDSVEHDGQRVGISRYGQVQAALVSVAEYNALMTGLGRPAVET